MDIVVGLAEKTRLVREFALGALSAQDFVDGYSNFYYYEALDGHEASSALQSEQLIALGPAVELHRRIQEQVVNKIWLDAEFSIQELEMAGRLNVSEARALALRICADIDIESVLSTINRTRGNPKKLR